VTERTTTTEQDLDLIRRVGAGDHAAFRVLVERYQGRLYRLALRVLRDEETARDAVQEGLLKAYASLARFEERSSFYTWIYRLVMNQCIDMQRRERASRRVTWSEGDPLEEAALEPALDAQLPEPTAPLEEVARKELREQVARAVDALPEAARTTLLLREVDGLSYAEIAEAQHIPRGTVMSRLHYARRRVQQAMRAAGFRSPDEEAAG
jgi:RNA polymerase sigma-70 factor (ECF subfamily)